MAGVLIGPMHLDGVSIAHAIDHAFGNAVFTTVPMHMDAVSIAAAINEQTTSTTTPTQVAALSAALTTEAPITALPVTATTHALDSGANVTVESGANTQVFVLSAAAALGATSLSITSDTPTFAFPSGSTVTAPITTTAHPSVRPMHLDGKSIADAINGGAGLL